MIFGDSINVILSSCIGLKLFKIFILWLLIGCLWLEAVVSSQYFFLLLIWPAEIIVIGKDSVFALYKPPCT